MHERVKSTELRVADLTDDPTAAADRLDEALGLWHGPACAEFADDDFPRPAAVHLIELRLLAVEDPGGLPARALVACCQADARRVLTLRY
jgi:hypothetical protein